MMNLAQVVDQYEDLKRSVDVLKRILFVRCKELESSIAIVGSKDSASLLLDALEGTDIPLVGIFDQARLQNRNTLAGHSIRPLEDLSSLGPEDIVLIASNASATALMETRQTIQTLCPAQILDLKNLADVYNVIMGLKKPLDFQYEEYLFDYWVRDRLGEDTPWSFLPPGIDMKDKTILELGPFEAHNTIALMQQCPKQVIALESRPINFAKVSVVQSLMGWSNFSLRLGDMHVFPELVREPIDIIFSSGVFYHSDKPWWLLQTCMDYCDTMILCGQVSSKHSPPGRKFKSVTLENETYEFEVYPEFGDPLSGMADHSLWFKEKDLQRFVEGMGCRYEKFNEWVNPHGLWICSTVTRPRSN